MATKTSPPLRLRRLNAPAIDRSLFARRRRRLFSSLGDGILILPTAPHPLRNADTHYPFRPGSDFHYLTGFPEPEAVLVASPGRTTLFVLPRDREREIWDGRRWGVEGARRAFGADAAFPVAELWQRLPELLQGHARVFATLGRDRRFDARLLEAQRHLATKQRRSNPPAHLALVDPLPALAELRRRKDAAEIALLTRAAEITGQGHLAAMRGARPGMREYEVQALLESEFRRGGARRNGYESIVAGGANACVLHYVENAGRLRAGDLLLIDAGAEYGGYTADVTRTFPVSGTFSGPQRAAYEIVLRAQLAAIAAAGPGVPWNRPHAVALRELTRGLVALGVLRGRVAKLVAKSAYKPWYMHGTSHWLGRDVHDVGAYQDQRGRPVRLEAGNVLTVEPGLYFAPDDRRVPKPLRGIGIRIEDDVLITSSGARVLTRAIPKSVAELEAVCGR